MNVGPFNQQSGIKGESAVDIDAELDVLNKKTVSNVKHPSREPNRENIKEPVR